MAPIKEVVPTALVITILSIWNGCASGADASNASRNSSNSSLAKLEESCLTVVKAMGLAEGNREIVEALGQMKTTTTASRRPMLKAVVPKRANVVCDLTAQSGPLTLDNYKCWLNKAKLAAAQAAGQDCTKAQQDVLAYNSNDLEACNPAECATSKKCAAFACRAPKQVLSKEGVPEPPKEKLGGVQLLKGPTWKVFESNTEVEFINSFVMTFNLMWDGASTSAATLMTGRSYLRGWPGIGKYRDPLGSFNPYGMGIRYGYPKPAQIGVSIFVRDDKGKEHEMTATGKDTTPLAPNHWYEFIVFVSPTAIEVHQNGVIGEGGSWGAPTSILSNTTTIVPPPNGKGKCTKRSPRAPGTCTEWKGKWAPIQAKGPNDSLTKRLTGAYKQSFTVSDWRLYSSIDELKKVTTTQSQEFAPQKCKFPAEIFVMTDACSRTGMCVAASSSPKTACSAEGALTMCKKVSLLAGTPFTNLMKRHGDIWSDRGSKLKPINGQCLIEPRGGLTAPLLAMQKSILCVSTNKGNRCTETKQTGCYVFYKDSGDLWIEYWKSKGPLTKCPNRKIEGLSINWLLTVAGPGKKFTPAMQFAFKVANQTQGDIIPCKHFDPPSDELFPHRLIDPAHAVAQWEKDLEAFTLGS